MLEKELARLKLLCFRVENCGAVDQFLALPVYLVIERVLVRGKFVKVYLGNGYVLVHGQKLLERYRVQVILRYA